MAMYLSTRITPEVCGADTFFKQQTDEVHHRRLVASGKKTFIDENGNESIPSANEVTVQQEEPTDSPNNLNYRDWEPKFNMLKSRYRIMVCVAAGIVFGWSMEKGRVFEPFNIRKQMLFQRNIMMKMFFTAMTTSLLCLTVLSILPATRDLFHAARFNYGSRFTTKGVITSTVGGWMLGMGMAISGSCPGAVLTQLGAGVNNCEYTLLGCLVGALVYGLVEKWIIAWITPTPEDKKFMCDVYFKVPYYQLALALACLIGLYVSIVEYIVPWQTDLAHPNPETSSVITLYGWPPLVAGVLVGILQIPIVIAVEETIGGSSGYCTLVSQLFSKETLKSVSPYLLSYKYGLDNWWQVLYIGGAIGGAFLSSTLSNSYGEATGVSAISGFTGALIMVFGSRLAGGCTSGSGLSGVGTLSVLSFYTVVAMFAGGIATAVIMTLAGVYAL